MSAPVGVVMPPDFLVDGIEIDRRLAGLMFRLWRAPLTFDDPTVTQVTIGHDGQVFGHTATLFPETDLERGMTCELNLVRLNSGIEAKSLIPNGEIAADGDWRIGERPRGDCETDAEKVFVTAHGGFPDVFRIL